MKNILIIGGTSGIGKSLTEKLSATHKLYVTSRNPQASNHPNVTYLQYDVSSGEFPTAALPAHLDGVVYCPGTINLRPFKGIKPETFEQDLQVNFMGLVKTLQYVLPQLQASATASVVAFSTVAVKMGMPFHTSVAGAKGAIEGFARAFAAEFAPKIRMNVIAPSLTDTPLADKFLNNDVKREKSAERHPLKKVGTPEEIASAAAYLLSEDSSWISGQIFHIDGGMSSLLTSV